MLDLVVDDTPDADRRFVLLALACLVPTMACARTTAATTEPPLAIPPAPIPEAVVVLGRQYLAAHPEDDDRQALRRALGLDGPTPEAAPFAHLDALLRHDLETRNVVQLEGWQLTRTECRLYALASLT